MGGLGTLYYMLTDYADRRRAGETRDQTSKAVNWLENFKAAESPEVQDLRMGQLRNVVSDPTIRDTVRESANALIKQQGLEAFTKEALEAGVYDPFKGSDGREQLPTEQEALFNLQSFADDQNVAPSVAASAHEVLKGMTRKAGAPTKLIEGDYDVTYDTAGNVRGKAKRPEPEGGSGKGGSLNDVDRRRERGINTMKGHLYATAQTFDPEISEIDGLLGDVDQAIKYDVYRARMSPEVRDVFDTMTQLTGQLAIDNGGDWQKASNTVQEKFKPVIEELKQRLQGGGTQGGAEPKAGAKPEAKDDFPSAPPVGTVISGYKYNGGDPSKRESWEKVK